MAINSPCRNTGGKLCNSRDQRRHIERENSEAKGRYTVTHSVEPFQVAKQFISSPLWNGALWIATTYRWHSTSEAPPIMGLIFANWATGVNLFREWTDALSNADEQDDIRVAVIEGDIEGQHTGYSIRISAAQADWEQVQMNRPAPSQVQRMQPLPQNPKMLQDFKREYIKHGEFLLAPVVQHDNDELHINVQAGIVKRECVFRDASEIGENDPDAIVFQQPHNFAALLGESHLHEDADLS